MIGCWSAPFLSNMICLGNTWVNLWLIKNALLNFSVLCLYRRIYIVNSFERFSVLVFTLNLYSLGVLTNKWNNVSVWGRQSAFWEYLWCLAQHCPFLLLTAPIHLQGQYAVLIAAMNQRRWEISSSTRHTKRHRKCFDIMTHQDTKMFAKCLICFSKASVPHQEA